MTKNKRRISWDQRHFLQTKPKEKKLFTALWSPTAGLDHVFLTLLREKRSNWVSRCPPAPLPGKPGTTFTAHGRGAPTAGSREVTSQSTFCTWNSRNNPSDSGTLGAWKRSESWPCLPASSHLLPHVSCSVAPSHTHSFLSSNSTLLASFPIALLQLGEFLSSLHTLLTSQTSPPQRHPVSSHTYSLPHPNLLWPSLSF